MTSGISTLNEDCWAALLQCVADDPVNGPGSLASLRKVSRLFRERVDVYLTTLWHSTCTRFGPRMDPLDLAEKMILIENSPSDLIPKN